MQQPKDRKKIYLDYAATSPVKEEVLRAMEPFYRDVFGNPSSVHSFGREARAAIDEVRESVASVLGCRSEEVYFTSGGTESDNMAIYGVVKAVKKERGSGFVPHIIISSIEHQAIDNACSGLEETGEATVTRVPVDKNGVVSIKGIEKAIRPETVLISMIYVSNEIGTVQPVREIGKLAKKIGQERGAKIYVHTDAVQAPEYFTVDVERLRVDLLSLSGHKFGAPKGVGILFVRRQVPISSIFKGGMQELALRPGTENTTGIIGIAKALEITSKKWDENIAEKVGKLRNLLEEKIKKALPEMMIIGEKADRSPAISAMVFPGVDAALLLMNLDLAGIAASSGSACASGSLETSHVLRALDLKEPYDGGAVRFSLSALTTRDEIERVVDEVPLLVKRLAGEVSETV